MYLLACAGYLFYWFLSLARIFAMKKLLLTLLFLGCIAVLFVVQQIRPINGHGARVELAVPQGASVRHVAHILDSAGVVSSADALVLFIRMMGLEKSIQAGIYSFYKNEGLLSTARRLRSARALEKSITIPEGLTVEQIAGLFSHSFLLDSAEFVSDCMNAAVVEKMQVYGPTLEGYLYPDTYRFPPDAKPQDIIRRMTDHFKSVIARLPEQQGGKKLTMQQLVTLASIIEKEAVLSEERTRISGVFHNRLRHNIPLGADPTVRFIFKKFDGPLRVSELKNPSPYNTRIHTGLPPGPICSPGSAALRAALAPLETTDLFFVARWDGSGAHEFSRTNEEHVRKKIEIRRENEQRLLQMKMGDTL
jgi:UPF0755 protein